MTIDTIHSFLVHPAKGVEEQPDISGTAIPKSGRLFEMLSEIYDKANKECQFEIAFLPNDEGEQKNECRDLLIEYVKGKTITEGRAISERLQRVTTNRSGLGLLFFMVGKNGKAPSISPPETGRRRRKYGKHFSGEGESPEHKALKLYIRDHPEIVGLPRSLAPGKIEKLLFSGDKPDVFFSHRGKPIAVEIKSRLSNGDDLNRGVYQCVKYQAVLKAEQLEDGAVPNAIAFLVCESRLPMELRDKARLFGVNVYDGVKSK